MRPLYLILAIGLCAPWTWSAPPAPSPEPTVEEVVQRHIAALGGIENIHRLRSLVVRGMYHEPGRFPPGTPDQPRNYMAFLRPYYQVLGDPALPHPDLREGFDGSAWEYYGDPGIVIRTVGAAAAATRHTAEFLQDSLIDYAEKGTRVVLQGTEDIAGSKAYRIAVTLDDGFQKLIFVDADSWLITAERKSAPIHAFGSSVRSENRFYDYRPVSGVLMPFRGEEVDLATGEVLSEGRRVIIEANTLDESSPKDRAIFSPQPYERTPVQELLEQLYAERADVVSVMHTYRLFRSAHKGVDTRSGIEFVGYQMAKTADFPSAIELLTANANDYPDSASAQYGLGRALQAAGKTGEAREAFNHALQIDPQFRKATDGLNALR
jgi:hypothetical protein